VNKSNYEKLLLIEGKGKKAKGENERREKKFHVCEVKAERLMDFRFCRHVLAAFVEARRFELELLSRFRCSIESRTVGSEISITFGSLHAKNPRGFASTNPLALATTLFSFLKHRATLPTRALMKFQLFRNKFHHGKPDAFN
jgi:hypothetical protein